MPTYYAEDYDGKKNDDAVKPVVLSPVTDGDSANSKRVASDSVEDKAVKSASTKKTAAKKKA